MAAAPGAKLFVGCLPYSKTEADLTSLFSTFGLLKEVALLKKGDGTSKGAAFVTFGNAMCAANAAARLQGYMFEGSDRAINVHVAAPGGPGGAGAGMAGPGVGMGIARPTTKGMGAFAGQQVNQRSTVPKAVSGKDLPGTKCFVGRLPFSKSDDELMKLFSSAGPVGELVVLRNKMTGEKTGAAMVRYTTPQHAAAAVAGLNGFLFHGSTRPIAVEIAQGGALSNMGTVGSLKRPAVTAGPGCKLFVGQLPFSKSELAIKEIFQNYGKVLEVSLHRNAHGQKTGGAFVNFDNPESAQQAMELDGFMFPGSTRGISLSVAAKKPRMA